MSEKLTTTLDVIGATLIATGTGLIFGLGAALIAAGVLVLAASWLVAA